MNGRAAAALRHRLWRLVLTLTGGLRVAGTLPRGGCVVVANHSSHADTAALLAALDPRHAPRVAAAADYWFAGGWRSAVCRTLAAAFPVRRTGGGSVDIAAAVTLLRAGRAVIVYPEGTRGCGEPGRFHAGAFRLAAAAGVPVVPVGIAGTARLLPKHGRLRRTRVTVRIGAPLRADPDAARAAVARLARTRLALVAAVPRGGDQPPGCAHRLGRRGVHPARRRPAPAAAAVRAGRARWLRPVHRRVHAGRPRLVVRRPITAGARMVPWGPRRTNQLPRRGRSSASPRSSCWWPSRWPSAPRPSPSPCRTCGCST